jgi:hypothetical protein
MGPEMLMHRWDTPYIHFLRLIIVLGPVSVPSGACSVLLNRTAVDGLCDHAIKRSRSEGAVGTDARETAAMETQDGDAMASIRADANSRLVSPTFSHSFRAFGLRVRVIQFTSAGLHDSKPRGRKGQQNIQLQHAVVSLRPGPPRVCVEREM